MVTRQSQPAALHQRRITSVATLGADRCRVQPPHRQAWTVQRSQRWFGQELSERTGADSSKRTQLTARIWTSAETKTPAQSHCCAAAAMLSLASKAGMGARTLVAARGSGGAPARAAHNAALRRSTHLASAAAATRSSSSSSLHALALLHRPRHLLAASPWPSTTARLFSSSSAATTTAAAAAATPAVAAPASAQPPALNLSSAYLLERMRRLGVQQPTEIQAAVRGARAGTAVRVRRSRCEANADAALVAVFGRVTLRCRPSLIWSPVAR